jgi:hypothetical protein
MATRLTWRTGWQDWNESCKEVKDGDPSGLEAICCYRRPRHCRPFASLARRQRHRNTCASTTNLHGLVLKARTEPRTITALVDPPTAGHVCRPTLPTYRNTGEQRRSGWFDPASATPEKKPSPNKKNELAEWKHGALLTQPTTSSGKRKYHGGNRGASPKGQKSRRVLWQRQATPGRRMSGASYGRSSGDYLLMDVVELVRVFLNSAGLYWL